MRVASAIRARVPQSVASRRIAALEEHFGERLFDRSTRRAALTPFGRDMLPSARRLVQLAEAMEYHAEQAKLRPLTLAVPETCQVSALAKLGAAAREQGIVLDFRPGRPAERAELLATAQVRAALVALPSDEADWIVPLGVASAAGAEAGPDFALTSDVAPGSSGKIISATALLAQGVVTENTPVACPFAYTVQGVNYDNDDGETLAASTPFAYDFAQSCNNAFDQWRSDESNGRLATAAREYYGLDEPWDIGMSESGTYYEQPPSPNQNVAVACLVLNAGYGAQFAASEVLKFLKSY